MFSLVGSSEALKQHKEELLFRVNCNNGVKYADLCLLAVIVHLIS